MGHNNGHFASLWDRFSALILDHMIIFFAFLLVHLLLKFLGKPITDLLTIQVSYIIVMTTYFIVWEAVFSFTPGKKFIHLTVESDDGTPIGWREASIRNLLRLIDFIPPHLYLVGVLFILNSDEKKRLGDIGAGTVVKKKHIE
jgi:uncharacterized RDD family membrane protein YckC